MHRGPRAGHYADPEHQVRPILVQKLVETIHKKPEMWSRRCPAPGAGGCARIARRGPPGNGRAAGQGQKYMLEFGLFAVPVVAVAQLVESRIVIPVVVGSSPISHPSKLLMNQELTPL